MSEGIEGLRIQRPEEFFAGFAGAARSGDPYNATLPRHLPEPPEFPLDALPEACRRLAREAAEAIGCPVDFIAVPMLAVGATAVGATRVIRLKRTWLEPAVLWVAVVGESGDKKTPAFKLAIAPLVEVQRKITGEYEEERRKYEERLREYDVEKKRSAKEGKVADAPPNLPRMGSVLVNDATLEAFVEILGSNPRGALKVEDELAGLIRSIDQYKGAGKGREKQVYLSSWSSAFLRIDRKTNPEPLIVPRPCASIAGNIQPGMLPVLVPSKEDPEGFLARILFGYPVAKNPGWTEDDVSAEAEEAYGRLVRALYSELESLPDQPPQEVPLSKEAKEIFKEFVNSHAAETNEPGFPQRLKPAWSKLEAYGARFALVLAMCRVAPRSRELHERVEAEDVKNALRLVEYFKMMAKRVYVELYGERRIDNLARDVAEFLKDQPQKRWRGQPEECFKLLEKRSKHLPPRANELRKELEYVAQRTPTFYFEATKSNGRRIWQLEIVDPDDPVDPPSPAGGEGLGTLDAPSDDEGGTANTPSENGYHGDVVAEHKASGAAADYSAMSLVRVVSDREGLEGLIASVRGATELALDVETFPRDELNSALDPRRGKVRLISVATPEGASGVVDATKVDPSPLLETLRGKVLIAHGGKFDLTFLKSCYGYEHNRPVIDTQVLDAVIYYAAGPRKEKAGWKGFPSNELPRRRLKDVVADYLGGLELDKTEQTSDFGKEELTTAQIRYSLRDAEVLLPLKGAMMERVAELGLERIAELEARVLPALAHCESNGFALDVEAWRERGERTERETARLKEECDALAPPLPEEAKWEAWGWTPSDHRKVGKALELLGAKVERRPQTGNYVVDERALTKIDTPERAANLAAKILEYREATKRNSTWGLGWFDPPRRLTPKGKKFAKSHQFVVDGRVYSSFAQVVRTGRMSSSSPNLQNIPPGLRECFSAPEGRRLLIADYKQIELVTAAVLTREEELLEAFERGEDVHSLTARRILESDPVRAGRPVTDEEVQAFRPKAKMVSFGILYGITAKGLAARITDRFGVTVSKEDAQSMIDGFLASYPALRAWYLGERKAADAGADVSRTLAGRLRLLDIEHRFGKWRSQYQLRLNTPIQGSAGDGFKYAVALLWESRRECPGDPRIVNLVHDEVVVEIDAEEVEVGKRWLERCMLDGMAEVLGPGAPVSVEISVSDNWGKN